MRSYEDISNRIMQRGDEIIESRKVRAAKIKHTSYAVSGMCAAVITGVGVWRFTLSMPKPDDQHTSPVITTTETTAERPVTTVKIPVTTQPATTTGHRSTISANTVSSSTVKQTESSYKTTTVRSKTTVAYSYTQTTTLAKPTPTSVPISITESITTTSMNGSPVTTVPHAVTTTLNQEIIEKTTDKTVLSSECLETLHITTTTRTETEVKRTLPFDYSEVIRSSSGRFRYNDTLYVKDGSIVPPENVGAFIRNTSVTFNASNGWEVVDGMALYEINGIDKEKAVAAKHYDLDEYFLFINIYFKEE
jgi:hypothetical protein